MSFGDGKRINQQHQVFQNNGLSARARSSDVWCCLPLPGPRVAVSAVQFAGGVPVPFSRRRHPVGSCSLSSFTAHACCFCCHSRVAREPVSVFAQLIDLTLICQEPTNHHQAPDHDGRDPSITQLAALLQQELAGITRDGRVLGAARQLLQQQRQQLHAAAKSGTSTSLTALPLAGLCLAHSVSQQQQQEASQPPSADSPADALWSAVLGGHHSPFLAALQEELQRLRSLISSCYGQLEQQLVSLAQQLPAAAPGNDSSRGLELAFLQQQADSLAAALAWLDNMASSECSKHARLAQQFDTAISAAAAQSHIGSGDPVQVLLPTPGVSSHSCSHRRNSYAAGVPADVHHQAIHNLLTPPGAAEPILWGLSVVYIRLRHAATNAQAAAAGGAAGAAATAAAGEAAAWQAPDMFKRSTTKFWVHPGHVLRLKLALLKELPLLVYGATDPLFAADISSSAALRAGSQDITSLITSVYCDSPALDVYNTRLARDDHARLVRLRFYGPRQLGAEGADQPVFVEMKTHREAWTGEPSVKERASLLQSQVPAFLATGELPPAGLGKGQQEQLLSQVHKYLTSWKQSPVLQTEYLRTAWQRYDSNAVRLSLDEHMLLLREAPVADGDWCASLEGAAELPACDAVRFPYAILELKLQEEPSAWVSELEASGLLVKAPRFSKFLQGMALLHPGATSPSWFLWDERRACAVPASLEEMREIARERDAWKQQEQQAAGGGGAAGPLLAALHVPRFSLTETGGGLLSSPAASSASLPAGGARGSSTSCSSSPSQCERRQRCSSCHSIHSTPCNGSTAKPAAAAAGGDGKPADVALDMEQLCSQAAAGAVNPQLAKLMQQLLPPVHVVAVGAAEPPKADADVLCSDSGSDSSKGGRSAKRGGLLQQVKAAAGRLRSLKGQRRGSSATGGGRGWSLPSTEPRARGRPTCVRTRAEPKTFFANERTFLSWLNLSVLVMMTGLGLLTGSSIVASGSGSACSDMMVCSAARISGAIISPLSIVFMCYALHLFRKRTRQILELSTMRYDDQNGPVLLTLLLVGVTIVAVALGVLSWRASTGAAV